MSAWTELKDPKPAETGWLMTTGTWKGARVRNIYDMAGNLCEWTMEGKDTNYRVIRGGVFDGYGSLEPVTARNSYNHDLMVNFTGFRPSLYIK